MGTLARLSLLCSLLSGCVFQSARFSSACSAPSEYAAQSVAEIIEKSREIVSAGNQKRALSLGLFGSKDIYTRGLLENIKLAKEFYPGWTVIAFIDPVTVPASIIVQAKELGALVKESPDYRNASARFFVADMDFDLFIVRDVDSRLTFREVAAVADFIRSDWAIVHGMRDYRAQKDPLQAGMWGAKTSALREKLQASQGASNMQELYTKFMAGKTAVYGDDQKFLAEIVVKAVGENHFLSHESYYCHEYLHSRGFPIPRGIGEEFIGARKE